MRSLALALAIALAAPLAAPPPVQAQPLAAYSAAADLPPAPAPALVGHAPNPWVAGFLAGWLGVYPFGALAGYAYAGDMDRGWRAVGRQTQGAGAGLVAGALLSPVLVFWPRPPDPYHGNAGAVIWLVMAPFMGAALGHWLVGLWNAPDAYDAARTWPTRVPAEQQVAP